MTFSEARQILGLGPDEDPRPHLREFHAARERIAELVRGAPNPVLADRYQQGLVEFDQALAAVHEYLQALGLEPKPDELTQGSPEPVNLPEQSEAATTRLHESTTDREKTRGRAGTFVVWMLVFLTGAAGGAWLYFRNEENQEIQRQSRITLLERVGSEYIENRRWQEASTVFAEIEQLMPGSELAKLGRRSIEAGMDEEQNQFVGYWTGQATAELEAGRPDEAMSAIRKVMERFPNESEARAVLARIKEAQASQTKEAAIAAARSLLDERRWNEAADSARSLAIRYPDSTEAKSILADASAALEKQRVDRTRAEELLNLAAARDQGQFDQQALDWLREAATLAPDHTEISARLEKMASYTRTLRVPGDFASPAEALAAARERDRIVLGEQVWKGPIVINVAVELQGAGSAKTIIECGATEGSAVTIGPGARGARLTGITFRHESFHAEGGERYAAALVRGGGATFSDCRFQNASGHGLAVIEGGEVFASHCRFSDNSWNGAAAIGDGCVLEIRDSEARDNFENGIESWNGASVTLVANRCESNSRNGIHADNGQGTAIIEGNQLIANREFGLLIGSAGNGRASGNLIRENLLGGLVVRRTAATITLTGNRVNLNEGPGLVLERGVPEADLASNKVENNKGRDVSIDSDL